MTIELASIIRDRNAELSEVTAGLAEGKAERVSSALITLVAGLATGRPELVALLSPFVQRGVQRAFACSATARLQAAFAATESALPTDRIGLSDAIEALLGQALLQMVRVQHQTTDGITEQLGGFRAEFAEFRREFQRELECTQVRVNVQHVLEGATGVRMGSGDAARLSIGEMTVSGTGSVGIDLGRK